MNYLITLVTLLSMLFIPLIASAEEPPPAAPAEESERKVEDWVRGMCPAFGREQQHAYWLQMRARYRESRRSLCRLKQTGTELIYAPFTLGVSLLSASERWERCLDNDFKWNFQSQIVSGRLEGYQAKRARSAQEANEFHITLANSGTLAMRDITMTCDLIGSKLQQISSSKQVKMDDPLLSGETRKLTVQLDPLDRWFCYSMCVYTYTTNY
ncbi:MAG: hypothetical protein GY725_20280 [bacterium]|nr:hypothetical protein [bacterium]